MELRGFLQTYAWGKVGKASLVGRLYGGDIEPNTTYAELWMGTHPSGTSQVIDIDKSLKDYIEENPRILGKHQDYWELNENLPFLFKVLSVNKALSIQVHPDKDMAELLHHNFPEVYKDPNYKPEMAIALTKFRALCGFRPVEELKDICVNVPELEIVGHELLVNYARTLDVISLRKILNSLLMRMDESVSAAVNKLLRRLKDADDDTKAKYRYELIQTLDNEFPGDPGIMVALFLNDVRLEPGEAIYIPAGLPHAYLSGDCIECMACSDNVVRAGLTPKHKDIETLLSILDYQSYTTHGVKLEPQCISPYTTRYNPPVPDFGVSRVCIPEGESWLSPVHDSCQILIVIDGEGSCIGECIIDLKPRTVIDNSKTKTDGIKVVVKESTDNKNRKEWHFKFGTIMFFQPFSQYKIASTKKLEIYFAYPNSQYILPDLPLLVNLN